MSCGLTPRSSGAPTAGHQAQVGGTLYIFTALGLASCRRRPLSSNVRPHVSPQRALLRSVYGYMSPTTRRVLQAVLYEVGAIAFVGPVLGFAFGKPATSTFLLAVILSTIALCWNYVFNALFERWESEQVVKGRSFARRLAHGAGFEGGLTFLLVPVMALWLETTFLAAFLANLGLLAFFFVYAIGYTWAFDKVFGLPQSALSAR